LFALAQVEPEFQDQVPFLGQGVFKRFDAQQGIIKDCPRYLSLGEGSDGVGIPASNIMSDGSRCRQAAPVALK
jgi:hypothetical protein